MEALDVLLLDLADKDMLKGGGVAVTALVATRVELEPQVVEEGLEAFAALDLALLDQVLAEVLDAVRLEDGLHSVLQICFGE